MSFTKLCAKKLTGSFVNLCHPYPNNMAFVKKSFCFLKNPTFSRSYFLCRGLNTVAGRAQNITKDDKRDFMAVFPDVLRDLTQLNPQISDLSAFISKIMQYNVSGGKKVRGLTVVYSFRMLSAEEDLTPENIRISQILGWCVEMLQGYYLILDDLIDQSETRRGRVCWYKLPDVGLRAVSDALIVESGLYQLLQRHCRDKPYYLPIVELFLDSARRTNYGQTMDYISSFSNIKKLTMDRYNFITKYKTSYYTYHLPVAIALYMAGIYDPELHRQARNVLLEMGHYFQVQDDFLDVFGDTEITGKIGTDIQEGKCTWLAVVAFQRATPLQQSILKDCYGCKDPEKIKIVKDLFIELGLPSVYHAYEEDTYNLITRQIQQLSQGLPHELFLTLLHKMHGRKQ